ncbi:hypothetical protein SLE2022_021940 [Rubroshorea leprosula]
MAKLILLSFLTLSCLVLTSNATTYTVGDTSGWDISTSLDSWTTGKIFKVGDVLVFQYSSSDSVCEVTRANFQTCNTTNVLSRYSGGNTTITLTQPGTRYFIDGNQLYCMGGMKLQVNVAGDAAFSPVAAPEPAAILTPNSKNGNPTSDGGIMFGGWGSLVAILVCLMGTAMHLL